MKTWQKIRENPSILPTYLMREKVIDAIRLFFKQQNFHEVDTPLLGENPGMEPFLDPFETKLLFSDGETKRAFLLTSPEYALKKLLVAGLPKIFQITKCFRNYEGKSSQHNPEFTMMEWYRANADYTDIMRDCEEMFYFILQQVLPDCVTKDTATLNYQGQKIDLRPNWERLSVAEAFQKYADIDTETLLSEPKLLEKGKEKGYKISDSTTWEEMFNQIFLNEVEKKLGQSRPTILYDYPIVLAGLSKKKPTDSRFAERFEFYIAGIELGNAFSELIDPDEQEKRLIEEEKMRAKFGKTTYAHNKDFIAALRVGMPPSGGIGVGIDRIVMLFADAPSIKETLFFPVEDMFELEKY